MPSIAVNNLHAAIPARLLHLMDSGKLCGLPNRILFPIDLSEGSISDARYVRTLGCRFRLEITLMHVLPPPAYGIDVQRGDVAHVVSCAAQRLRTDLVMIGSSSESGLVGRLRANAYFVIRQSPCPVISV